MNDPKHPVRPDFSRSADAVTAWRERQKALLDQRAREEYERLAAVTEREKREAARRQRAERERLVEAEKSRMLLEKPNVMLRMLPSQRLRESMAYGKAADVVRRAHAHEIEMIGRDGQRRADAFLREQERERARASEAMREQFRTAGLDAALKSAARVKEREGRERGDDGRER